MTKEYIYFKSLQNIQEFSGYIYSNKMDLALAIKWDMEDEDTMRKKEVFQQILAHL